MFSWASTSVPAATSPTRGTWRTGRRSTAAPELGSQRTSMARGLVGSRTQVAEALEGGEVGVHRRGGGEADRLADLAHRRRVAPVALVLLDDLEDLALTGGDVLGHGVLPGSGGDGDATERSIEQVFAPYGRVEPKGKHLFDTRSSTA